MATAMLKPDQTVLRTYFSTSNVVPPLKLATVWTVALAEMLVLYFPPFRAADEGELMDQARIALRAYLEDLAEFDEPELRAAWRTVRRAHKRRDWPTIDEIRDACLLLVAAPPPRQSTIAEAPSAVVYGRDGAKPPPEKFPYAAQADRFMSTVPAQRALSEGWGAEVWDHVAQFGQEPWPEDLDRLRTDGLRRAALFEIALSTTPPGSHAHRLASMAIENEARLVGRFLRVARQLEPADAGR